MIKPGLTVHRLELFLAVLDHGGWVAPPGLPHQPARRLRAPAWTRSTLWRPARRASGRRVRPTARRAWSSHTRGGLALLRTAEQSGGRRARGSGGLPHDRCQHDSRYLLLPAALGQFHATYPGSPSGSRSAIPGHRALGGGGSTGAGSDRRSAAVPGLAAEPWVKDELVLIVPRGHPFARRRSVRAPRLPPNRTSPARKARARAAWPSAISRGRVHAHPSNGAGEH